jgi:preprotein translocase subunit SecF
MRIVPHKKLWLGISVAMVVVSILAVLVYGFRLSADFTEGTLYALKFTGEQSTTKDQFRAGIDSFKPKEGQEPIEGLELKEGTDRTFILKLRRLETEESQDFLTHLEKELGKFELLQSRDVSPIYAQTFRNKALFALFLASLGIILYITFAFRKVSRGIKSWKLGIAAVIALLHDVISMVGIFVILGHFFGVEMDVLFITALLSVMGFSVHDTIVVFDRVRENLLHKHYQETFEEVAERSVQQTLARSINISFSALLVLVPMLFLGASEIYYFTLALIIGITIGTYSSIFVATPLLTYFEKGEKH